MKNVQFLFIRWAFLLLEKKGQLNELRKKNKDESKYKMKRAYVFLHDIYWYLSSIIHLSARFTYFPIKHSELKTFKFLPLPLIDVTMFGILGDTWLFFNEKFIRRNFVLKNHREFRILFCSPTNRSPTALWLVLWEETCHSTANFCFHVSQAWAFWGSMRAGPLMSMLKLKYKQEILNYP